MTVFPRSSRIDLTRKEIDQTKTILLNLQNEQANLALEKLKIIKRISIDTQFVDLYSQGFIQNKDISELILLSRNLSDDEKIQALHLLVQDSDLNNAITSYKGILRNLKRREKELAKKEQLKSALKDYLG